MNESRNMPGLTPVWIIVLATILAALVPIGIPYIFKDDIRPSDWLGFAGNIVTAGVALLAAAIAWRAVQRQITAQAEIARGQSEIQRLTILQERIAIMEDDRRVVNKIGKLAPTIGAIPEIVFSERRITRDFAKFAEAQFEKYTELLEAAVNEFEVIGARRRAVTVHTAKRAEIGWAVVTFERQIIEVRKAVFAAAEGAAVPANASQLASQGNSVQKACNDYAIELIKEIRRLDDLVNQTAQRAGL